MRIAYDHQIFSLQWYGGVSRYFVELANRVAFMPGVTARVFAFAHLNQHLKDALPGVVVGQRVHRRLGRLTRVLDIAAAPLGFALFSPDIVHETYYSRWRLAPRRARIVVTVHDMIPERCPEHFSPTDSTAALKAAAVSRADHVICVSENTRRDVIELLKVSPADTSVVHHGWNLPEKDVAFEPPVDGPYLLYVGFRAGYKNHQRLLEAFARSPVLHGTFKLVSFGGGPYTATELDNISRLGLTPSQVPHVGGGDRTLSALYRHARAFIYPSLYEGFGMPLLEAMSFGCPVVCSATSSLPEVAGPAAVYFDPTDVESLRAAIERVVGSHEYSALLKASGYARLQQFSWDRCAQQTLAIYRQL